MKRFLLCTTALMVTIASAIAQEVINIHMKDGSVKSFNNGIRKSTAIDFWSYEPDTTHFDIVTGHENGYSASWDVNGIDHSGNQYTVLVYWTDMLPTAFEAEHGVCFGTQPGLTVENCDAYMLYTSNAHTSRSLNSNDTLKHYEHYMLIGAGIPSLGRMAVSAPDVPYEKQQWWSDFYTPPYELWFSQADSLCNFIKQQLEYGQTYFYRTFAKATYAEGSNPVYFYGTEHSFRVPNVMGDNGYYNRPVPTAEAMEEFGQLFPEGTFIPAWEKFEPLWNLWRTTDEGSAIDLTADITTKQFDDGTGYRLHRIPSEFYTWLTQREIEIDPIEGEFAVSTIYDAHNNDYIETFVCHPVTDVDATWGVPGNNYMKFVPAEASYSSPSVTYSCHELVPGTKYQLQVFFAPETVVEPTDENSSALAPTKARIILNCTRNGQSETKRVISSYEVPATEVTTIAIDECLSEIDLGVKVESRVTNSNINNGYNRILRIAGMKLTPLTEQAEQQ